jgi:hypothetical protein
MSSTHARSHGKLIPLAKPVKIITAAEMDRMTPQERADAVEFRTREELGRCRRVISGQKCSSPHLNSASSAVGRVPERPVRFTQQFLNRLDWLLPGERRHRLHTPSVTDFLSPARSPFPGSLRYSWRPFSEPCRTGHRTPCGAQALSLERTGSPSR